MPWAIVEDHTTFYSERSGCFPLCETCWEFLNVEQRLPYYKLLWLRWGVEFRPEWKLIENAVKEGK